MKILLKLFSIDTLIEVVIDLLAGLVKNPGSERAIRLRYAVHKLNHATEEFLRKVL